MSGLHHIFEDGRSTLRLHRMKVSLDSCYLRLVSCRLQLLGERKVIAAVDNISVALALFNQSHLLDFSPVPCMYMYSSVTKGYLDQPPASYGGVVDYKHTAVVPETLQYPPNVKSSPWYSILLSTWKTEVLGRGKVDVAPTAAGQTTYLKGTRTPGLRYCTVLIIKNDAGAGGSCRWWCYCRCGRCCGRGRCASCGRGRGRGRGRRGRRFLRRRRFVVWRRRRMMVRRPSLLQCNYCGHEGEETQSLELHV
ncbi:hypothetical protein BDY17DRAFT_109376 [Neohortaea acidophila]|uniref:Uncharacterized protein n=1 Tax=Neohortaea acidophila TaxID=245834 RepID=A0A6A6Q0X3_9PEZI|nr:uncharacterized protein BDY17DRAFT_109376 [Neohortaea acidophila]KAF2485644.1 hypothetical protein BDY17DRAFT_109376 [Neohortaea acidophila]